MSTNTSFFKLLEICYEEIDRENLFIFVKKQNIVQTRWPQLVRIWRVGYMSSPNPKREFDLSLQPTLEELVGLALCSCYIIDSVFLFS